MTRWHRRLILSRSPRPCFSWTTFKVMVDWVLHLFNTLGLEVGDHQARGAAKHLQMPWPPHGRVARLTFPFRQLIANSTLRFLAGTRRDRLHRICDFVRVGIRVPYVVLLSCLLALLPDCVERRGKWMTDRAMVPAPVRAAGHAAI